MTPSVERPAQDRLLALERDVVTEVVPQAQGDGGQVETGPPDPAVRHTGAVAARGRLVLVDVEGHAPIMPATAVTLGPSDLASETSP